MFLCNPVSSNKLKGNTSWTVLIVQDYKKCTANWKDESDLFA
jgi:hypothetical protein